MAECSYESGFNSGEKPDDCAILVTQTIAHPYFYYFDNRDNESSLQEKLKAACQNIEFLKVEHVTTIRELHKEIEKLQNHVRDLQFQHGVLEVIVPDNDFFNCDIVTLEQKVDALISDNRDTKRRLQESNKALQTLDQRQKLERWQQQKELEEKDKIIIRLQKELETKCSTISELTSSQTSQKKKGGFFRQLLSLNTEQTIPNVKPVLASKCPDAASVATTSLETDGCKENYLMESRSPSHSLNCAYSSYSSLSDRSTSDEEGLRTPALRKQYTFPSPKRGFKKNWFPANQDETLKLPPLPVLPKHNRPLVRHQIRVEKMAAKTPLDSVAIDQVTLPEIVDKT